MARLNNSNTKAKSNVAIEATDSVGVNHNGALGSIKTPKSELFLLGVSSFNEDKFYEAAVATHKRIAVLTDAVLKEADGPTWLYDFVKYLRSTANMRTISIVIALETANNMLKAGITGGRQIVNVALQRADEPGEALAYWHSRFGRNIPSPVKRGIADAAVRLYGEYSLYKYDSSRKAYRFADVIQLTHPNPKDSSQSEVFKAALDRRYGNSTDIGSLRSSVSGEELRNMAENGKLTDFMRETGMTWEAVSGKIVGGMDAVVWEQIIPTLGYMALLRNLRNFSDAGISHSVVDKINARISDPKNVAESKQLPFRFWSAYEANKDNDNYSLALSRAFDASVSNIPELPGNTLILVDMSGSMFYSHSQHSNLSYADTAALFGATLALRSDKATLVTFGTNSATHPFSKGESAFRLTSKIKHGMGGTSINSAIRRHLYRQDRVVLLTDEQYNSGLETDGRTPFYIWNLAGYRFGSKHDDNIFYGGGLNDSAFAFISQVEAARNHDWPWA